MKLRNCVILLTIPIDDCSEEKTKEKKLINKHIDEAGGQIMRAWSLDRNSNIENKASEKVCGLECKHEKASEDFFCEINIRQNIKVQLKSFSS